MITKLWVLGSIATILYSFVTVVIDTARWFKHR
jgi:hypothetical protein